MIQKRAKGGLRSRGLPITMSTFSWNCRGLGTQWALQFLKKFVLQKKPNFVFLCEILCNKNKVDRVRDMLGFEGAIAVDSQGHSGGLAFLWRNKDEVTLLSLRKNHIDVLIDMKGVQKYRLTGIYGEPD